MLGFLLGILLPVDISDAAVNDHISWIVRNSEYHIPARLPKVRIANALEWEIISRLEGHNSKYFYGVYFRKTEWIILSPRADEGVLVHEIGHHLQDAPDGVLTGCQRYTYEAEAWTLQVKWLDEHGMDITKADVERQLNVMVADKLCNK